LLNKKASSTATIFGRAIAQAVSCWFPTAAARVRAQVWSSGICGGQSGAGAGFLRVLRFPLSIFIPPNSPSSSIIRGWYNRPFSGRRGPSLDSTPPPPTRRIIKRTGYYFLHFWSHVLERFRLSILFVLKSYETETDEPKLVICFKLNV
jgi:hypothetical protein